MQIDNKTYNGPKNHTNGLSVDYTYRIYRILVFLIFLLILVRLGSETDDYEQFKFVSSALIIYLLMERFYPSVTINN